MSEYDDDGARMHDEPDEHPGTLDADLVCECGAEYVGRAVHCDRSYDSPGWYEPEPGEELCPECRENLTRPVQPEGD